jgi:predicted dehydrogenase
LGIATFLEAVKGGNPELATVQQTREVTAILEAGRKSLDGGGWRVDLGIRGEI